MKGKKRLFTAPLFKCVLKCDDVIRGTVSGNTCTSLPSRFSPDLKTHGTHPTKCSSKKEIRIERFCRLLLKKQDLQILLVNEFCDAVLLESELKTI